MEHKSNLSAAIDCIIESRALIKRKMNEQVIRDNFTSYLRKIFPSEPSWIRGHIHGGETALKLIRTNRKTTGFVDNLVNSTVIEYESNLSSKAKFDTGYKQVKEYCASVLNSGVSPSMIIGVLSDTINWYAYEIDVSSVTEIGKNTEGTINLIKLEELNLTGDNKKDAHRLIDFLTKYFGRIGARPLTGNTIADDLGFGSGFCLSHLKTIEEVVSNAFKDNPKYANLIEELWCNFVGYLRDQGKGESFEIKTYIEEFYILTLAKLVCANFIEQQSLLSNPSELKSILNGNFFENKSLLNFVEYDYFGWLNEAPHLQTVMKVAQQIQLDLRAYDFKSVAHEDIFGKLMSQLANRSQRILLGQEWTPSWVSKKLVNEVISKIPKNEPLHLIDMCCGSGSMIVETLKVAKDRISNRDNEATLSQKLELLSNAITGFDIDPLAVMLSKVNWVLSASDWIREGAFQPVLIPIYHADSLFAITPLSKGVNFDDEMSEFYNLQLAEHVIKLPKFLVTPNHQVLFDRLVDTGYKIVIDVKENDSLAVNKDDLLELLVVVVEEMNITITKDDLYLVQDFLFEFITKIDLLNREGRNGVWAFILRNSYRPGLVSGQFNGLVSNPPWLALSKIADNPYKVILKQKANKYAIKPEGSSHLHIELATIFLLHSIESYLQDNAAIGCIMPETILNGHHHNRFRKESYLATNNPVPFSINEIWRIQEDVFKNKAIIIFGKKNISEPTELEPIEGKYIREEGDEEIKFYRHIQGNRTAWSERPKTSKEVGFYQTADFKQGADIMPRNLLFYEITHHKGQNFSSINGINRTNSFLGFLVKDAKKYTDFNLTSRKVSNDVLYDVFISKMLTPFIISPPQKAILPIQKDENGHWREMSSIELRTKGASTKSTFNEINNKLADGGDPHLMQKINARNKLIQQVIPEEGYIVITGAGGGRVCSAYIEIARFDYSRIIIDQTLYWTVVKTEDEAIYLVGLFNSDAVSSIIEDFQPQGGFGKRHVHKLPFKVTPPYDPGQAAHQDVVNATKLLYMNYMGKINQEIDLENLTLPNTGSLARRRKKITNSLKTLDSYLQYDEACKALYGLE